MLNISQVCDLYAWLYTDLPMPPGTFDHIIPQDGCFTAIKSLDGIDYVMFRGSVTMLDWIVDLTRVAEPLQDGLLGPVHTGFALSVRMVQERIDALVGKTVVVVGHSLGAGHAAIYAGYRVARGKPVDRIIMFGEPRPGMAKLAGILAPVPIYSFCNRDDNGHDLVCDIPFSFPPLLNYQHPRPLQFVKHSPRADDPWSLFRYHHFFHYAAALGATGPAVMSLTR